MGRQSGRPKNDPRPGRVRDGPRVRSPGYVSMEQTRVMAFTRSLHRVREGDEMYTDVFKKEATFGLTLSQGGFLSKYLVTVLFSSNLTLFKYIRDFLERFSAHCHGIFF